MRRIVLLLLVSSAVAIGKASAASRPHYGGTLHVAAQAAPTTLDPASLPQNDMVTRTILPAIFDSLVFLDHEGVARSALARSWEISANQRQWRFLLRPGVSFSDMSPLSGQIAAESLRGANPAWRVSSGGDSVVIELDAPAPDLLAELALPRNSILKRDGGKLIGTGAFVISQLEPSKKLVLVARDDYWRGRPFLDSIEVSLGKNYREQMIAFDLAHEQLIELPSEQSHQDASESMNVRTSAPGDLLALVFANDARSPDEVKLRQALSLSIDRGLINNVLLQGKGEATAALLPNWMTGYEFVSPANPDLTRAQQLRGDVSQAPLWTLSYDSGDSVARVIAERIVLNARDAGLRLQLGDASTADLKLAKICLVSADPELAMRAAAEASGMEPPKFTGNDVGEIYMQERSLLQALKIIPLLHLRTAYAVSPNLRGLVVSRDGRWNLPDVWLAAKP